MGKLWQSCTILHLKCELSDVIHVLYLNSLYLELKALGQCGCEQWKGFSPVWLKVWSRSFSCEPNRAPHTKHSFPLALPPSSPSSSTLSLSLSFPLSRSLSLSVRGSGAVLPNSLAAVRCPSSSGVSAVIRCEASAAAAAMAALECRCHENSLVAPLPCRLNVGSCLGVVKKSSQEWPMIQWKHQCIPKSAVRQKVQALRPTVFKFVATHIFPIKSTSYLFKSFLSFFCPCTFLLTLSASIDPLLQTCLFSSSPCSNSNGWRWVGNTALHFYSPARREQTRQIWGLVDKKWLQCLFISKLWQTEFINLENNSVPAGQKWKLCSL